jgi:iron complex outermembrane recepter protein
MQSQAYKARKYAERQAVFKLNPIAAACAAAFLLASTNSFAQQASTATTTEEQQALAAKKKKEGEAVELDAVKVTGIRRSIENAIEKKKESTSIVEVISAEDIGKLPDNSIADAISRAPGITSQRIAGRASEINIRGFAGDFSTTLLNGREQVSVGDNRGVEFDQYPSELIGGVTIYKTPDARLVGQGVSGTVDLQTLKPLSYSERSISLNARGEQNSLGDVNPDFSANGSRISATYIDQFADNTFGVAIGFARLDSPGESQQWEATGYQTNVASRRPEPGNPNPLFNPNDPLFDVLYQSGSKQRAGSTDNVRTGVMGIFEYRPNDTFRSELDIFYSKFEKAEVARGMEMGLGWTGAEPTGGTPGEVFDLRHVVSGTFTGITPVQKHELNTANDDIFSIGWNNKLKLNEDWTAVLDLSGSSAKRDDQVLELYAGATDAADNPLPQTVTFTINPSTGLPTYTFSRNNSDPSVVRLTDSSGWGQAGYLKDFKVRDDQVALRLNLKRDFLEGAFSSVEFGVNYAERDKSRQSIEYILRLAAGSAVPTNIPSGLLLSPVIQDLTGGWPIVAFDLQGALDSGLYVRSLNSPGDVYDKNWKVNEQVTTAFAQLNIDTQWGSVPVRGNVGAQFIQTDQSSDGFGANGAGTIATPITGGAKYNDFLPSLNLSFELPYDQFIRFGAAKTLARARLDRMRASNQYSCNFEAPNQFHGTLLGTQCFWRGNAGNPQLEPTRTNSFDLAYEKYFDTKAFIGLAYFYKKLTTYDYEQDAQFDFTGYVNPGTLTPVSNTGIVRYFLNGTGGYVKGFEFNASFPLSMVWDKLDGFGFTFNASDIKSSVETNGPGSARPLPGLSTLSANGTFYYENHGFSARISKRYRDSFLGEDRGFAGNRAFDYYSPEVITDIQIGYAFKDGTSLEGLSLLLQVNNLTNDPYGQYYLRDGDGGSQVAPKRYGEYGRTVLLGLNYKF